MKFSFMVLATFLMNNAYSWEVKTLKSNFYLSDKDKTFSIVSEGGTPKFIRVEELNPQFDKIIYYAGTAGTSDMCEIHRALVLSKTTKRVLGDFPVSYKCTRSPINKAVWVLKNKTLEVTDPQTEMTQKVILP